MVSGYAFCDIVVTTLRQNVDQAGSGTCGLVGSPEHPEPCRIYQEGSGALLDWNHA